MKVLVTGVAGLLGRNVVRRLLERGDDVFGIDALCRYEMMGEAKLQAFPAEFLNSPRLSLLRAPFDSSDAFSSISEWKPDAVVHAAAQTSHPRSIDMPMLDFEVNALGTMRLLEFLRGWKGGPAPRLVFISTAKVYGMNVCPAFRDRGDGRLCLDDHFYNTETPDHDARAHWFDGAGVTESCPIGMGAMTPFGASKTLADAQCQEYARHYGLDVVVLRPGCFTGPGSLATTAQNWLPPLVHAAVRGTPYEVYGFGGKQVRDLLHADDLATAVLACVDGKPGHADAGVGDDVEASIPIAYEWTGDVFNVGGGPENSVSILEANEIIGEIAGKRAELVMKPERPLDWPWCVLSNAKIKTALGWEPKIGVRETIRQLIEEAKA